MDAEHYPNALAGDAHDGADIESSFAQGLGDAAAHHAHDGAQPEPSAFAHEFSAIDPALNDPPEAHYHHAQDAVHPQSHHEQQHIPRQMYSDIARNATQFSIHTSGEQLSSISPARLHSDSPTPARPSYVPPDRVLPSKETTDETLDDAYVDFILYCNPSVPLDCDTAELRKAFRQPPKSDGKMFNMLKLMELIRQFEEGEVKTWTQLAIDLGVERKADSSTQKVQQYAVRLKRWMHAMHVDAFFEYMFGKPHNYYEQIPAPGQEPKEGRDGVPLEEDLALKCLYPETRPKRGRRRADDKEDSNEPDSKRQHMDDGARNSVEPSSAIDFNPYSAGVPPSAVTDTASRFMDAEPVTPDQWTAATQSVLSAGNSADTPTGSQQFKWRATAYPRPPDSASPASARAPPRLQTNISATSQDDTGTPLTAATPTTKRARRRHGPAVSSAWPSSSNPMTGRLRGRPPTNRSVRDGPFSTFPANPSGKGHTVNLSPHTVTVTPTPSPSVNHTPPEFRFRPQQLHLTVPEQPSRVPIRLATPSSTVHAPTDSSWAHPADAHPHHVPPPSQHQHTKSPSAPADTDFAPPNPQLPSAHDLQNSLCLALLQASTSTHPRPDVSEIQLISRALISNVAASLSQPSAFSLPVAPHDKLALFANWDSGGPGAVGAGPGATACAFRGMELIRLPSELEEMGFHDPDPELEDADAEGEAEETDPGALGVGVVSCGDPGDASGVRRGSKRREEAERRYRVRWRAAWGGLRGEFETVVELGPNSTAAAEAEGAVGAQFTERHHGDVLGLGGYHMAGRDGREGREEMEGGEGVDGAELEDGEVGEEGLRARILVLENALRQKTATLNRIREVITTLVPDAVIRG